MTSDINKIIAEHNLVPGDEMKNIHGDEIMGSIVLSKHAFLLSCGKAYRLYYETPFTGERVDFWLPAEAIAAIRSSTI